MGAVNLWDETLPKDLPYRKLLEFELNEVDPDIKDLFMSIKPGYHGLPTQMQIARHLKKIIDLERTKRMLGL